MCASVCVLGLAGKALEGYLSFPKTDQCLTALHQWTDHGTVTFNNQLTIFVVYCFKCPTTDISHLQHRY